MALSTLPSFVCCNPHFQTLMLDLKWTLSLCIGLEPELTIFKTSLFYMLSVTKASKPT